MENKGISSCIPPKIFNDIRNDLEKEFSNSSTHIVSYAKSNDNNELTIKVRLKGNTDINTHSSDILFYIVIDYLFPESKPYVQCFSNFCLPTLWDGRNLLYSILNQNWIKETTIIDIIKALPEFLSRVLENYNNKVLVYYGDYQIEKVFDMNEFLMNAELYFFKVFHKLRKDKKIYIKDRYVVLTDIYFLLFEPVPENRSCGRLLFWGDIRQIMNCKGSDISSEYLLLEWKNDEDKINVNFELGFIKPTVSDFMSKSSNKIIKLKENFKIFQEDMNKPGSDEDLQISTDKLITLIKYKEDLMTKRCTVNIVRELMNMYQKIIEILSAKNDPSFTIYLDKLHKMLQNQKLDSYPDSVNVEKEEKYDLTISTNNNEDGNYKLRQRKSFKISDSVFSTFNANLDKSEN